MKIKLSILVSVALVSFSLRAFAEPDLIINFSQQDVLTFGGIDGPSFTAAPYSEPSDPPGMTYSISGTESDQPTTGGQGVLFDLAGWPGTFDRFILGGGGVGATGLITFSTSLPTSPGAILTSAEPLPDGDVFPYTVQFNDDRFVAVPEPSTLIADALPLALLGAQTLRGLQLKRRPLTEHP